MKPEDYARRASVRVLFSGVDITQDIQPYLLSLSYTDNEDDDTDDLQLKLQDRDKLWLESWLEEAVNGAAAGKLKISADIIAKNWNGYGIDKKLPCGCFELDSVTADGPPSTITIKATSLSFSDAMRQTDRHKAWEGYNLSGIANEMASECGLTVLYDADTNPYYSRKEQFNVSNICFLNELCHDAGLSLKVTNCQIVIYSQSSWEKRNSIITIKHMDGGYEKYKLSMSSADTQYGSCRVYYTDPGSGKCIEGIAKADSSDTQSDQVLEVYRKVSSVAEAQTVASSLLRLHNKFERTAQFTMPGNPALVAGLTVQLADFGGWNGKYMIKTARHTVSSSYTTQITLRRILEGY